MKAREILSGALMLAAVTACSADVRTSDAAVAGESDVIGTYLAADSGNTLGKHWCYSGALVLDTTHHFGSVIKMCSDDGGGPVTENLKGTYSLRRTSLRVAGQRQRVLALDVILKPEGSRHNSHTLRYEDGTLRFDEPWWMGAGMRALEIPDPVLKKLADSLVADSSGMPSASSTAPVSVKSSATIPSVRNKAGKTPAKK
jgi:hypothetical protein